MIFDPLMKRFTSLYVQLLRAIAEPHIFSALKSKKKMCVAPRFSFLLDFLFGNITKQGIKQLQR